MSNEMELEKLELEETVDEEKEEALEESSDEVTEPSDYRVVLDLIKEMQSQYQTLKEFSEQRIKADYGLNSDVLMDILSLTKEDIDQISLEEGKDFLSKHMEEPELLDTLIKENQITGPDEDNYTEVGALRHILQDIKEDSMNLFSTEQEMKKLRNDSSDILNEYFTYLSSKEAQQQRMKRLKRMKEAAEKESNEVEKKKIMKMISAMEASYDLSFLFTRFEKLGKKEISSIKEAYFDKNKGSYIIDKYKTKIKNFGFEPKLYHYFFNIEENFLEEEYHIYNNLFLFIYMRMVAYNDPYDKTEKMYIQSLTSNLANLIYHRFDSTENEKNFLEIIKKVLNHFEEYRDYFKEYNTTQPTHPARIEAMRKHETKRKEMLIEKMTQLKITGFDEEASANELQEYLNTAIEEMVKSQTKETNLETVEVDESEDGISIAPVMKEKEESDKEIEREDCITITGTPFTGPVTFREDNSENK